MKLEIFEENESLIEDVRGNRSFYSQIGYLHRSDSRFPVRIKIPRKGDEPPYKAGFYEISDLSYRVNNYEKLEIDPYNLVLTAVDPEKSKRGR